MNQQKRRLFYYFYYLLNGVCACVCAFFAFHWSSVFYFYWLFTFNMHKHQFNYGYCAVSVTKLHSVVLALALTLRFKIDPQRNQRDECAVDFWCILVNAHHLGCWVWITFFRCLLRKCRHFSNWICRSVGTHYTCALRMCIASHCIV